MVNQFSQLKSGFYVLRLDVSGCSDQPAAGHLVIASPAFDYLEEAETFKASLPENDPVQVVASDGKKLVKFNCALSELMGDAAPHPGFASSGEEALNLWESSVLFPFLKCRGFYGVSCSTFFDNHAGCDCRLIVCQKKLTIGAVVDYPATFLFFYC